ncbi:hypothetical protein ANN_19337 [Periplaneta americana]|uniref:Uncharacterized protein n=1 Tax=Periplaneta americana TaxID=6978 RepID=A0ABQ8SAJ0_PERAM|nr:hypothetical protein ANN_19337 [Periplaneta americana]
MLNRQVFQYYCYGVFGLRKEQKGCGCQYLKENFTSLNEGKLKEGIFIGPQIRKVMLHSLFEEKLSVTERMTWRSFKDVCSNFLGNSRADNYIELVETMLSAYEKMSMIYSRPFQVDSPRDVPWLPWVNWSRAKPRREKSTFERYDGDNASEMSPGFSAERYSVFALNGLRINPGRILKQGITPIEIDRQLCQVYGPNVMSKQMLRCSTRSSVMMDGLPLRSSSCTFGVLLKSVYSSNAPSACP